MSQPKARHALSGRQILVSGPLAAVVVVAAYAWQRAHSAPEGPDNFTIALSDYRFTPDHSREVALGVVHSFRTTFSL